MLWTTSKSSQPIPHIPSTKSIAANTKLSILRYSKTFHPTPTNTNIISNTHFKFADPTLSKTVCEDLVRVIHYFKNFRRHLILMFVIVDLLLKLKSVGSRLRVRIGGELL